MRLGDISKQNPDAVGRYLALDTLRKDLELQRTVIHKERVMEIKMHPAMEYGTVGVILTSVASVIALGYFGSGLVPHPAAAVVLKHVVPSVVAISSMLPMMRYSPVLMQKVSEAIARKSKGKAAEQLERNYQKMHQSILQLEKAECLVLSGAQEQILKTHPHLKPRLQAVFAHAVAVRNDPQNFYQGVSYQAIPPTPPLTLRPPSRRKS